MTQPATAPSAEALRQLAWSAVAQVVDPEIPVLTIADLGVLRGVEVRDGHVEVTITPTYSGCPAMNMIALEIEVALAKAGIAGASIRTVLSPPWTTDWMTADGRRKLSRVRHRAAQSGRRPPGPVRRGGGGLPALRLQRYAADLRVRLHRVQGAVALPGLPGAVRLLQVPLSQHR